MSEKNKTYKDYLSNLLSFLDEKEDIRSRDLDQLLTEAGYEADKVGKKFQDIANQAIAKSPHNWRNSASIAHQSAEADYHSRKNFKAKRYRSRAELLDVINALLSQENLKVAFANRNFSDETDEDLESFLNQLEHVISQKPKDIDE